MIAVVWNLIASDVIDAGGRWDAAFTGNYRLTTPRELSPAEADTGG